MTVLRPNNTTSAAVIESPGSDDFSVKINKSLCKHIGKQINPALGELVSEFGLNIPPTRRSYRDGTSV